MKNSILMLLLFISHSKISYSQNKNGKIDELFEKTKCGRGKSIKPKVNCFSVDTCYITYRSYQLVFTKWIDDVADDRQVFVNNKSYKLVRIENEKENLITSKAEFPDYNTSRFYIKKRDSLILIVSRLPSCTGISCQYNLSQVLDLQENICYEKIVKSKD